MFDKLKALLAAEKAVRYARQHPTEITDMKLKPGFTTSSFWTLIATQVMLLGMAALGKLDGEMAVLIGAILTAGYNFVRNGFKLSLGMKLREGVQTSEFWAMLLTGVGDLVLAALDKVDGTWATLAAAAIAALYKAGRLSITGMMVKQEAGKKGS
jgi:hypothetical protein